MEMMKKYKFPSVFLFALIALIISSCVSWQKNYGKLKIIPKNSNEITIQNLIDKWDDYNIYYSDQYDGFSVRSALGIMFDPKNNDTTLVGDRWKEAAMTPLQKDLLLLYEAFQSYHCPNALFLKLSKNVEMFRN